MCSLGSYQNTPTLSLFMNMEPRYCVTDVLCWASKCFYCAPFHALCTDLRLTSSGNVDQPYTMGSGSYSHPQIFSQSAPLTLWHIYELAMLATQPQDFCPVIFSCDMIGCSRTFKSEPALRHHQIMVHIILGALCPAHSNHKPL
jgi:hypothetical protein